MTRVWTLVRRFFCRGASVTICSTRALPESNITAVERAIQAHRDFVGSIPVLRPLLIAANIGAKLQSTVTNKTREQQGIQVAPAHLTRYPHFGFWSNSTSGNQELWSVSADE